VTRRVCVSVLTRVTNVVCAHSEVVNWASGVMAISQVVDYERLEPIPASYGVAGIILSIAFFQTLNQTVLWIGCPRAVGRDNAYWKWRNLGVSWVHALIVGVWDITW